MHPLPWCCQLPPVSRHLGRQQRPPEHLHSRCWTGNFCRWRQHFVLRERKGRDPLGLRRGSWGRYSRWFLTGVPDSQGEVWCLSAQLAFEAVGQAGKKKNIYP